MTDSDEPLRKKRKTVFSPPPLPTSSSVTMRSSQVKLTKDFNDWAENVKTWSSLDDDFVLVATNVVQEVSRPVSSDNTRNINIWLEKECVDCAGRRKRSGLNRRLESVNWSEIAEGRKCSDVSRKVMALVSQATEAAKSGFKNGDIKMLIFEMLSLGYGSWLCSKHLSTVVKKMPGTIHDEAAMEITSMWKCDGVVQITDEMELTGLPDVVIVLDGLAITNTTVTVAELKKDSWRSDFPYVNKLVKGDIDNCELGQLLAYMYGTIILSIQTGKSLYRLLGLFVEGRKAVIVRAVVDKEVNRDGEVIYYVTFGHTALGSNVIDIFSSNGISAVLLLATRFVSSQVLGNTASAASTSASDTD